MKKDIHSGFQDVNQTPDSEFLFQFLDKADCHPSIQQYKQLMLELSPVNEGVSILDIGCGIGHELHRLTKLVGPKGRLLGVDKSDLMINEAMRRATELKLAVQYHIGDAASLDFLDNASLDYARTERVLMYIQHPEQVLAEIFRVLKPSGQIVMFEFDYSGAMMGSNNQDLCRKVQQLLLDSVPSGAIGSQLPHLLYELGFQEIKFVPHTIMGPYALYQRVAEGTLEEAVENGSLTAKEFNAWWDEMKKAEENGHFLSAFPGFVVSGRKPN